ncbi:Outer membrane efflux protein BepC precursor [Roseovarius litorisediminis]|uniref:Outer membrane efflux protein BepC n=1 Tax=Roseovarius litorisediminis TaxID=1312363 RepID=A0A1Y5SED3_9RHOB|nr:TolC family outer membrane protein [Roseovarius litorisediminis]SLN38803.1 Outer membrane efflux protein BepC precursor [Roseovarius litorisediminis]
MLKLVVVQRLSLLIFSLAFLVGSPSVARAETLADALASAYTHSGLLDQNRALLRAADEGVAQAVSRLRPIIDWSSDMTRNFGRTKNLGRITSTGSTDVNLGITASLLLYDYGQTKFSIEAAKETVLATRQTLISIEQQVLLRAVQAYMNVIRNGEFVALRESNLRLLRQELRAAQDRFDVGEVTRTDVAQAEARLAAAQSGLAAAQGDLVQAIEEFRAAIGRKPGKLKTPTRLPSLSDKVDAAKQAAVRRHPDLLKAQHDVATADLNILVADAAMKPSVNLTGRLGAGKELGDDDNARTGSFGVQVTGPIYRGGQLSAAKRQAMAQRDAQRGALHLARLQVEQDVGNAYANLRATRASRDSSQEQVRAATVAFRGVREEAKLGARTTLDVLDAEQELLDARANLISADADVYIAAYAVLAAMGQLTAKDLNLGVQTYDANAYFDLVKDAPTPASKQGQKLDRVLRALNKD